jgi:2'-5' RNA ligase
VPAHVTLFHQLPGEAEGEIGHELRAAAAGQRPTALRVTGLRHMGKGVAYQLASSELSALRGRLAERWTPWLGRQDQQPWKPHVTVQNKVTPDAARALYERLSAGFTPFDVTAEGLLLWRYLGGPWEASGRFPFSQG